MSVQHESSAITLKEDSFKNKVEELEDLVVLAEEVSQNIDELVEQRTALFYSLAISFYLFIGLFMVARLFYRLEYLQVQKGDTLFLLIILISLPFSLYLSKKLSTRAKLSKKIYSESLVLKTLLDMIHPYKESVFNNNSSTIKKAVIDMRLNRIKFSTGNISKPKTQNSIVKKVVDFV